ncbi:hypothetical protein NLG97_g9034 [Lecanicillium saksenae]|uniref:Uncharacterized protein n=1 Tax=Lecanicillium saksenae TaxID=468837 RepID=A0ACC1QL34_9HYPO|nr:hypothetical protein NLG97_g9034 [Lecanicillium saksenae]
MQQAARDDYMATDLTGGDPSKRQRSVASAYEVEFLEEEEGVVAGKRMRLEDKRTLYGHVTLFNSHDLVRVAKQKLEYHKEVNL